LYIADNQLRNGKVSYPVKNKGQQEEQYIQIAAGNVMLDANICIPKKADRLIIFAHGSGSNRHSPRNRQVAQTMRKAGLATLLVSLLTVEEEAADLIEGHLRFNIELLGSRLMGITDWLHENPLTSSFKFGIFGASTGAAGALICAAERPEYIQAVVSRGGRPDMAARFLERVQSPTLLIVGGADFPIIDLNRRALSVLGCEKELVSIPGATHLFEEPGALEKVAELTRYWFVSHLNLR
jgi:putative phosphoribosyl transferase